SANPEWIDVDPPSTFGTWSTGCYSYSGSGTYTITVIITPGGPDTTPPTISITNPSDGDIVYSSDVTVSWSGSDNVGIAYYETRINGGSWINKGTSSSHLYTGLADGGYSVDVRAWDVAGNSDTDTVAFTVDATGNPVEKYAVIVGISDYKAINDLSYCDEDATDWYNHLTGTGMAFDHVWVYGDGHTSNFPQHDGYATEYNVKQALINVVNSADSNDIIVFTTSGHGSGNGAGSSYLCMWDCGAGESGEDGDFYDTELSAILDGAIADKIFVFIDHCYSGGFGPDLLSMPNSADIYCTTTCTENGYGYDVPSYQNGAWTYYFLEYSWINHYGGSTSVSMEDVFTYAHNNYPYGGGDEPQEFDGDTSTFFYLS
ncbi:MAG: caspase family protein, partial [Promethearchaeota archaeon]